MIYKPLLNESIINLSFLTSKDYTLLRGSLIKSSTTRRYKKAITSRILHRPESKNITHLQPAILRVCRSIHNEALPILYRQTFYFEHPIAMKLFLFAIRPANRLLLQHVVLRGWDYWAPNVWQEALASALDRLASAQNLKSLHLDRHVQSYQDGVPDWNTKIWRQEAQTKHFNEHFGYWADCIDAARGKGTTKAILTFADRNFGSEDEVARGDQKFLECKKMLMDKIKLD
ncbi:unnamed protein product [Aureobasidium uvarum]|uniref:DUF7730 domain-containing protein n=1 Tax=Aureobasidium uvarum TaxID=2773716 RepID=A0A9N8K9P2_9PEZI|nr:unnamed protein product [Aureobasidium uvarum]